MFDHQSTSAPAPAELAAPEPAQLEVAQSAAAQSAAAQVEVAESAAARSGSAGSDDPLRGSAVSESPFIGSFDLAFSALESAAAGVVACGVPADAKALVALRACVDHLNAAIAEAEVRFDSFELWRDEGAGSMRAWMMDACGLARGKASAQSKRVQRLERWPAIAEAWRSGRLSATQVECVVAGVPHRFVELFAEHAPEVVDIIADLDPAACEIAMREWVRRAENLDDPSNLRERPSGLHLDRLLDGHVAIDGMLCPADAAIVAAAIADFDVPDPVDENGEPIGEPRTQSQRRADALVAACRFASAHRLGASESGRHLPHVSLVIDIEQLRASALRGAGIRSAADLDRLAESHHWSTAERAWFADALARGLHGTSVTHDGLELDATATAALSCDSVIQRVLLAGDKVLNMGRIVRSATAVQRRAIIARDRHCRAPGCRTGPQHCDVHHIDHWVTGGRTDVDRMVLLCGTHHRQFHRPGHRMELDEQAVFTVHSPKGWSRSTTPERIERQYFTRLRT